jgi:hypothetical protein
MPKPDFDTRSTGIGQPPPSKQAIQLTVATARSKALKQAKQQEEAERKAAKKGHECGYCGQRYRVEAEMMVHERACAMLSRGDKATTVRNHEPSSSKANAHDDDGDDPLEKLLRKTELFANSLQQSSSTGEAPWLNPPPTAAPKFWDDAFVRGRHRVDNSREEKEQAKQQQQKQQQQQRQQQQQHQQMQQQQQRRKPTFNFDAHEDQWLFFEDLLELSKTSTTSPSQLLQYSDTPFLPTENYRGMLDQLLEYEPVRRKAMIRTLLLRWHPDRWASNSELFVSREEFGRVIEKVSEVSQCINQMKKSANV